MGEAKSRLCENHGMERIYIEEGLGIVKKHLSGSWFELFDTAAVGRSGFEVHRSVEKYPGRQSRTPLMFFSETPILTRVLGFNCLMQPQLAEMILKCIDPLRDILDVHLVLR